MSVVASFLAIILCLAFLTSGLQKVIFNPAMSESAGNLGFTKRAYQRIGSLEIAGAVGLLAGLAAKGSSFWAVLNELAAAGFFLLMMGAVVVHVRKGDKAKFFNPPLVLGLLALLEMAVRLSL